MSGPSQLQAASAARLAAANAAEREWPGVRVLETVTVQIVEVVDGDDPFLYALTGHPTDPTQTLDETGRRAMAHALLNAARAMNV